MSGGAGGASSVPATIALGAVTADFKDAVFDARLDQEKVPALLEARDLPELARLSEAHLKLSEGQGAELLWRDAPDALLAIRRTVEFYEFNGNQEIANFYRRALPDDGKANPASEGH